MALPTWTNIPDTDLDVGSPLKEDDVGQALRDNAIACRRWLQAHDFAEDTTTSGTASDVTGSGVTIYIPDMADYTGIARQVKFAIEAKVTSGEGEYQLYNATDTIEGTWVAVTATTYTWTELTISNAAATKGDNVNYKVRFRRSSGTGTVYARATNSITLRIDF